jgi:hypothetical protein
MNKQTGFGQRKSRTEKIPKKIGIIQLKALILQPLNYKPNCSDEKRHSPKKLPLSCF